MIDPDDQIDARFLQDLGWFVVNTIGNEPPMPPTELSSAIEDKYNAWVNGQIQCESPIERILLEKIIFCNDGYKEVQWDEAPGQFEAPVDDWSTWFEMQASIPPYRVDFLFTCRCEGFVRKLVVECDGHNFHEKTKEQAKRDKARDRDLVRKGIAVLRFTGSEIFRDPEKCREEIESVLCDLAESVAAKAGHMSPRKDR